MYCCACIFVGRNTATADGRRARSHALWRLHDNEASTCKVKSSCSSISRLNVVEVCVHALCAGGSVRVRVRFGLCCVCVCQIMKRPESKLQYIKIGFCFCLLAIFFSSFFFSSKKNFAREGKIGRKREREKERKKLPSKPLPYEEKL